jgi:quinolinate synthase
VQKNTRVGLPLRLQTDENKDMSSNTLQELLLLGQGADLASERGVSCTGDLPDASDPDLVARAVAAKAALGSRALILGHHYQRDEVIAFADITGDSFKLAQAAAAQSTAEFIIFCGVHFMAESADILTGAHQKVILPDLAAGCSMADMATASQVQKCWDDLAKLGLNKVTVPVTYMNSSAAIKSFTGEHGGTICTSSNAEKTLRWAFEKAEKVLFLPDQHLGRNTAVSDLGLSLEDCVVWNPWKPQGGLSEEEIRNAKMILWRGHCSVHGRFTAESITEFRQRIPEVKVIVHPECQHEVVTAADVVGSTEKIIKTVSESAPGSQWAVGTELNLVSRLAAENPDKKVYFLDRTVCYCSTMNRIDLPHLVWALESLVAGKIVNQISVDPETARYSKLALEQMLAL